MDDTHSHKYLGNVRKFLRLDKLPPVARKAIVFTEAVSGVVIPWSPTAFVAGLDVRCPER